MKDKTDNYEIMKHAACDRFMTYDQEKILAILPLSHDEENIYVDFFSRKYRIDRKTGMLYRGEKEADCNEVLSVYDFICNARTAPAPTGIWRTMTDLTSRAGAGPVSMAMFAQKLECFADRTESLRQACISLGGTEEKVGDVSFRIPVFQNFLFWFQYWEADEEFPASVSFLWDSITPEYLHYETLWYIIHVFLDRLADVIRESK